VPSDALTRFTEGLDYPVYVVTAGADDGPAGCLVGFATQVSIDPPRLLVCLSVQNHTYAVARAATHLGVHVLDPGRRELAELFGGSTGDRVDKFDRCRWHLGPQGVPVLDDCERWLVGRVLDRLELGDHVGFVLEPVADSSAAAGSSAEPATAGLSYQQVRDIDPGHDA
jgi:flavin reductase (DIM6/NTAB) family NADH-FMN oxidoreductase RutF